MLEGKKNEYIEFCENNFPNSEISEKFAHIYKIICSNNVMYDIERKYMNVNTKFLNEEKFIFFQRYVTGINKILIYLPLNDNIGIFSCMRYSIEQFLKFIYSIYLNDSVEIINKKGYRHIKERIKKLKLEENINLFFNLYSTYSKNMHNKDSIKSDEIEFLNEIITSSNEYVDKIEKDLNRVFIITVIFVVKIFDIKFKDLSVAERLKMQRILSHGNMKKIKKIMRE